MDLYVITAAAGKNHDSLEGGKGSVTSWSMQTGKRQRSFQFEAARTQVNSVVFNHNGNLVAAGGADGFVRVFDMAQSGAIMGWPAHEGQVACLRFSADETGLISAGLDGLVAEWSLHRIGRRIRTWHLPSSRDSHVHHFVASTSNTPAVASGAWSAAYASTGTFSFDPFIYSHSHWPIIRADLAVDETGSDSRNPRFLTSGAKAFFFDSSCETSVCAVSVHTAPVSSVDWNASKNMCLTTSADATVRVFSASQLLPV